MITVRRTSLVASILLLSACAPRAPIALRPLEPGDLDWGSMDFNAQAELQRNGTGSLDLAIDLSIQHFGTSAARMDLASAMIRSDQLNWERCQTHYELDSDRLLIVLAPDEVTSLSFTCLEVPRPQYSLVLRFAGSGMGNTSPYIDIPFGGMRNR